MDDVHQSMMVQALEEARRALDRGEFPVGCVLAEADQVLARGSRHNSSGQPNEIDHAEMVTLRDLIHRNPNIDCTRLVCYSTMEPCLMCYTTMLLSGVRTFVWAYEDVMGGGLNLPLPLLNPLYAKMEVFLHGPVLRQESLALFQQFFRSYPYWQGSLLASYTLAQSLEKHS
ncbi:MAG: tRNA-specific adenosine deaminase [Desulfobulbus propionicus]|nr:MAG: tRNA-specific adenosine deaminase [Desulfobulbus propionicus]